ATSTTAARRSSVSAARIRSPRRASVSARPRKAASSSGARSRARPNAAFASFGLPRRIRTCPIPTCGSARSGATRAASPYAPSASSSRPRWVATCPRRRASLYRSYRAVGSVMRSSRSCGRPDQLDEEGFLDVQAVLGLLEDQAARTVHDRRGDLLAAMGWETVHRHRTRAGRIHEGVVHAVGGKGITACLGLGLLAHRCPRVRVDDVRAGDEHIWIVTEYQVTATLLRATLGDRHDARVRAIPLRVRETHLHPERSRDTAQQL